LTLKRKSLNPKREKAEEKKKRGLMRNRGGDAQKRQPMAGEKKEPERFSNQEKTEMGEKKKNKVLTLNPKNGIKKRR